MKIYFWEQLQLTPSNKVRLATVATTIDATVVPKYQRQIKLSASVYEHVLYTKIRSKIRL